MLLSLHSYYFYELGFPLFPVLGMLFSLCFIFFAALFYRDRLIGAVRSAYRPIVFIFIISFLGIFSILLLGVSPMWSRFFALILFGGLVIHFCYLRFYHSDGLEVSLRWCLITHLSFFWLQVLCHYFGFGFLDFLEPVTGEAQRVFGGNYSVPFTGQRLIRGAGLYSEPGTFATFIFLLYLLYKSIYCFNRGVSEVLFGLFDFLVVLSVVFSFSIFGFVFVCMFFLFSSFFDWRRLFVILPLLIVFAFIAFETYIYPRFFGGISTDTGLGFRSEGILVYVQKVSDNPILFLFGSGFFNDYAVFSSEIVWNDLGLFFSFLMLVGVVGLFSTLFLFIFIVGKLRFYDFLLLTVLCLSKISLSMAFFWVLLSAVLGKKPVFNKL